MQAIDAALGRAGVSVLCDDKYEAAGCRHDHGFPSELPDAVVSDLRKLDDINNEIMNEQDDDMLEFVRERGWDGDPDTLYNHCFDDDIT